MTKDQSCSETPAAEEGGAGSFVPVVERPIREHVDHRRSGWFDIFPPAVVEVNVSAIHPAASAGDWHGHHRQDDFWFVASGFLVVGLKDDENSHVVHMGPGDLLYIPAGVWHTYKAQGRAVLVYGLTNKWDGTDEMRMPFSPIEQEMFG